MLFVSHKARELQDIFTNLPSTAGHRNRAGEWVQASAQIFGIPTDDADFADDDDLRVAWLLNNQAAAGDNGAHWQGFTTGGTRALTSAWGFVDGDADLTGSGMRRFSSWDREARTVSALSLIHQRKIILTSGTGISK